MSDEAKRKEAMHGHFMGEQEDSFGSLAEGLSKHGDLAPPSDALIDSVLGARSAAPAAESAAPPADADQSASAGDDAAAAPAADGGDAALDDLLSGADSSAPETVAEASASAESPAASQAAEAADGAGNSQRQDPVVSADDADQAISGLLGSAGESGLQQAVTEPPALPATLSGRLPAVSADDAAEPDQAPADAAAEDEAPAAVSDDDEDDLLASLMQDDGPATNTDESASAPAEEADPLASLMGGDEDEADSEGESDPFAAMMGGDDEPASAESAPESSDATGIDDLFGSDDEAITPAADVTAEPEAPVAEPTSIPSGSSGSDPARETAKVRPFKAGQGKLYDQLEQLPSGQVPLAADQFLTDLETEMNETGTPISDDLQAQLDKRASKDAFPVPEDTGVVGEGGRRVIAAAEQSPDVTSIEELIGGETPSTRREAASSDEPQGLDELFSAEEAAPAETPAPAAEAPAQPSTQDDADDPWGSSSDADEDKEVASQEEVEGWLGGTPDLDDSGSGDDVWGSGGGEAVEELADSQVPSIPSGGDGGTRVLDSGVTTLTSDSDGSGESAGLSGQDIADAQTIMLSKEEAKELEHAKPVLRETKMYEVVAGMTGFVLLLSSCAVYAWFYFYTGAY